MDKNYYDILQVNKNASPEIIEKAYKVLAKKYHPDLQPEENKKQSEEIFKKINEAYEVLSNPEKKQAYDESLLERERNNSNTAQKRQTNNTTNATSQQSNNDFSHSNPLSEEELRYRQQQELLRKQQMQQERQYQEQLQCEQELAYQQELQQARQKAYYDAYIQDLKNRGYKIRYKKSLKQYIKDIFAILLVILIILILWQIPFIKNYFISLYEENEILHMIVDIFIDAF